LGFEPGVNNDDGEIDEVDIISAFGFTFIEIIIAAV